MSAEREPLPRPEFRRPRLRQIGEQSWIDVDEVVAIDIVAGELGWPIRTVQIVVRGGTVRTAAVPGIEDGDTDETADRLAREWTAQRFGDITGADMHTLADLGALFGVEDPSREQRVEAAEDRAEQAAFDAARERS